MDRGRSLIGRLAFWVLVALLLVNVLFPFYWAVNTSLKSENQLMMTPATFLPLNPVTKRLSISWANYLGVFANRSFMRGILNSVIVASSVTLLALAFGSFAAFALGKLRFRAKRPVLYLILSMTMFPQVSVLSGLYAVMRGLDIHAMLSMILTYMLFTLPFTIWVMTTYFRALPDSLLQAANVDGATPFQAFRLILLPLAAPAAATTGILAFIAAWNEYLFALTFTSVEQQSRTIPVAIALFAGQVSRQEPFGEVMAASVLVTIPLLVIVVIFQRRIIEGLTAGGVKE
ncbi:MAG: carbohydrate ABC transporter permease [Treponema sp.]|nr:carbohydrate ABC transporter permease [Treponema sp.]